MTEPLDELYFQWLYRLVASPREKNPTRTYWFLTRILFRTEYYGFIPNDDNRVEDGRDLRYEFLNDTGTDSDAAWLGIECSMFEMLVGVSRRLAFEAEGEPADWFWTLITNLDLHIYNDFFSQSARDELRVSEILRRVTERTYEPNGVGGLFPLQFPDRDQRTVEIWYQLSAYLLERS